MGQQAETHHVKDISKTIAYPQATKDGAAGCGSARKSASGRMRSSAPRRRHGGVDVLSSTARPSVGVEMVRKVKSNVLSTSSRNRIATGGAPGVARRRGCGRRRLASGLDHLHNAVVPAGVPQSRPSIAAQAADGVSIIADGGMTFGDVAKAVPQARTP